MCVARGSSPWADSMLWLVGLLSDHPRYEPVGVLAKGAFGCVLLANDRVSGGQVALKALERSQVAGSHTETLVHMLLRHTHVIELLEVLLTETHLILVLEYAAGGTLADLIPAGGLPEAEARWLFQQVLFAMDYVHKMGVANRDIKLENVLVSSPLQTPLQHTKHATSQPIVKIADFGLSTVAGQGDSSSAGLAGTPLYFSPEAIKRQQPKDAKSADVWSLGVLLYTMVTGSFPFLRRKDAQLPAEQRMLAMLERIVAVDYVVPPGLSSSCADFIACMLTPDPSQRPSVEALLHHPWCAEGLPATAVLQANDFFLARSRANPPPQEVVDEVRSILQEARQGPAAPGIPPPQAPTFTMARVGSGDSDQTCTSVINMGII